MSFARCRYLDRGNEGDRRQHAGLCATIDRFWSAFREHEPDIVAGFAYPARFDLPGFMTTFLGPLDERLRWEIGPAGPAKHFLAISPETHLPLGVLVRMIVERAPTLSGWVWHAYRPPRPPDLVDAAVRARTGNGVAGWRASVEHGSDYQFDVTCYMPRADARDVGIESRAWVAVAELLGERQTHEWIGKVNVETSWLPRGQPLAALPAAVESLIVEIRGRLDAQPHWRRDTAPAGPGRQQVGSLYELQAPAAGDYPGQADLRVATTDLWNTWWKAAHQQQGFFSKRFSRVGETYCYVKLDGTEGMEHEAFRDRNEIHEALDEALVAQELGVSVGGGHGNRYSYVELALVDVARSIEVVRAVLQKGRVPCRSWLQFFDSDHMAEWIGIYSDSPPPPMPWVAPKDMPGPPMTRIHNRRPAMVNAEEVARVHKASLGPGEPLR